VLAEEFDLDFVCELRAEGDPTANDVYELLASVIEGSAIYGPISQRKPRCVRVTFDAHCHVDIVPAVPDPERGSTFILIPDRSESSWSWKPTNPKGYARWFEQLQEARVLAKAASVEPLPLPKEAGEKSPLQIAVQLVKRSHQLVVAENVRTPSIVHTTIAGHSAAGEGSISDAFDAVVTQRSSTRQIRGI
jgi:hypothetical protein